MSGVTLDAGALIALDRNNRQVIALLERARERGDIVTVPASALAQAIRKPEQQARLSRFIRQSTTDVVPLDRVDAVRVGRLLATTGTADVVDAHVIECARRTKTAVVTSEPKDLRQLDPNVHLAVI